MKKVEVIGDHEFLGPSKKFEKHWKRALRRYNETPDDPKWKKFQANLIRLDPEIGEMWKHKEDESAADAALTDIMNG